MDEYYKCSKIQVISNNFPIIIPKSGECSLKVFASYGIITVKAIKSKIYFTQEAEEELIIHEVGLFL